MLKNIFTIFFIASSIIKNCVPNMADEKQDIIESLNKKLNVKHISIIKDLDFHVDARIFNFAKKMFGENIFVSFMSASEMDVSMNEYYKTPIEYYFLEYKEKYGILESKKREKWVYPPRTIVMPYGSNVERIIYYLFRVRKLKL